MSFDVSEELRRTFDLAALRSEAQTLKTTHHWQQLSDIRTRHDALRLDEDKALEREWDKRVDIAYRKLMHGSAAAGRALSHPHAAQVQNSQEEMLRRAQRRVKAGHELRLIKIDESEAKETRALLKQAHRENNQSGKARYGFKKAAERRSGVDRRKGQSPSPGPVRS